MKKLLLIISLLLQSIILISQDSITIDKYNFDKDCYDGAQQEINYCLSNVSKKLSEIVQKKFECLVSYFDLKINEYSFSKDTSLVADYIKEKQFLTSSQLAWEKLAEENASFWEIGGGTITPMYVAISLIKDKKDRLIWLDSIIEEEGQGDVIVVLKCE